MPVTGISQINQRYRQLMQNVESSKTREVLTRISIFAAGESKLLAPVEYSTLVNSQYREIGQRNGGMFARVGYRQTYAAALHNRTNWRPRPVHMKYGPAWNPDAKPGYLLKAFEDADNVARIKAIIRSGYTL